MLNILSLTPFSNLILINFRLSRILHLQVLFRQWLHPLQSTELCFPMLLEEKTILNFCMGKKYFPQPCFSRHVSRSSPFNWTVASIIKVWFLICLRLIFTKQSVFIYQLCLTAITSTVCSPKKEGRFIKTTMTIIMAFPYTTTMNFLEDWSWK